VKVRGGRASKIVITDPNWWGERINYRESCGFPRMLSQQ